MKIARSIARQTRPLTQRLSQGSFRRFAPRMLAMLSLFLLVGCASGGGKVTLDDWRGTVEKYIDTEGQGDPNSLRNVTWPDSRRGFSVIGGDLPSQSQDANGVLLGVPQVGNQRWFVFVVGIVDQGAVKDIRLVAMTSAAGQRSWRIGKPDPAALKSYQAYNEKRWRSRFPSRQTAPMQYTIFPQEADAFDLKTNAGTVIATHPASGATWQLSLAAAPR